MTVLPLAFRCRTDPGPCVSSCVAFLVLNRKIMSLKTDIVYNDSIWPHIKFLNIYNYGPGLIKVARNRSSRIYIWGSRKLSQPDHDSNGLEFLGKIYISFVTLLSSGNSMTMAGQWLAGTSHTVQDTQQSVCIGYQVQISIYAHLKRLLHVNDPKEGNFNKCIQTKRKYRQEIFCSQGQCKNQKLTQIWNPLLLRAYSLRKL